MNDFYKELIEKATHSSIIQSQTNKVNSDKFPQTFYIRNIQCDQKSIEHLLNCLEISATVLVISADSLGYSYQITLKNK